MEAKKIVIGIMLAVALTFAGGAAYSVVTGPEPAMACEYPCS